MNNVIIFDFDGVIADTFEIVYAIKRAENPKLTRDDYRQHFEGNINEAVAREMRPKLDFFAEFAKQILQAPLAAGITPIIQGLSQQFSLVIVSSTINQLIEDYLQHHNLRQHFQEILGNDISPSKIEKFRMMLEKYAAPAEQTVFITDTLGDLKEANHIGLKTIAVTWGYQPRATLAKGQPNAMIENPNEIIPQVEALLAD